MRNTLMLCSIRSSWSKSCAHPLLNYASAGSYFIVYTTTTRYGICVMYIRYNTYVRTYVRNTPWLILKCYLGHPNIPETHKLPRWRKVVWRNSYFVCWVQLGSLVCCSVISASCRSRCCHFSVLLLTLSIGRYNNVYIQYSIRTILVGAGGDGDGSSRRHRPQYKRTLASFVLHIV